mgnify:CR=1 FL=1
MTAGAPPALGAHLRRQDGRDGVHFSVWAPDAHGVDLCLFEPGAASESRRVALQPAGDGVWAVFVPDLAAGQRQGGRHSFGLTNRKALSRNSLRQSNLTGTRQG